MQDALLHQRSPLMIARGLTKHFPIGKKRLGHERTVVRAVDGVDFHIAAGETLGIVGESGCGKSTTARLLMHLISPDSGSLVYDGQDVGKRGGLSLRELRRSMQMVFQDSFSSLNPRMTISDTIAFGPKINGTGRALARKEARDLLDLVGLSPELFAQRYPHELSGGQRQRVNIARALAMKPKILILDEAVSALDKSVEAQVLNLLMRLKREIGLTYIFISHDLNVVQFASDRVLVMYLGKVIEMGPVSQLYAAPLHPYTSALLASRLSTDPTRRISTPPLTGDPPNPIDPPSGCRFRTRCPIAQPVCAERVPALASPARDAHVRDAHVVACHARDPASGYRQAA